MTERTRQATSPDRRDPRRLDAAVPALLVAMTIWGATYVVTKVALPHMGPFTILLLRLLLGTAALLPFAWRQGFRPHLAFQRSSCSSG